MPLVFDWIPGLFNAGTKLNFDMQHQQQTQWCWSATAVSVSHFYWSWSGWDQCELVNAEFNQTTCCDDGSTSQCNQPWYTANALKRTKNWQNTIAGTLTRDQVLDELNAGRVIAARIGWSGGGGHAMVIYGYNPIFDWLFIGDPWYGDQIVDYDTYVSAYQGSGSWTHCYMTKPYNPIFDWKFEIMPLTLKYPPPYVSRILERDLSMLMRPPQVQQLRTQDVEQNRQMDKMRVHTTHPVYTVSLVNAQRSVLDDARITSWRSLVSDGDTPLASVDVRADENVREETLKISQFNEGPFVQSTAEALEKARSLKQTQKSDFEVRTLEIPALYVRALWLKNNDGDDLIIPLSPAPTAFEPGRAYSSREFNKVVSELSTQRLSQDDDELVG